MPPFLRPPVFADENRTRSARQTWVVIWTLIAVGMFFMPVFWIVLPENWDRWVWMFVDITVPGLVLLYLVRRGAVRAASVALLVGLWMLVSGMAWTGGGIRGPAAVNYLLVIVMAGLLLGLRAGIVTTAICGASSLGLVVAGMRGMLPVAA